MWVTNNEGTGAWMMVTFKGKTEITRLEY